VGATLRLAVSPDVNNPGDYNGTVTASINGEGGFNTGFQTPNVAAINIQNDTVI
jgi:hypothetical protein